MKFLPALVTGFLLVSPTLAAADVSQPVVSDSRVKTFVYNENEVYTILTQYGYQTNIEFAKNEEIQTVSVGDRVAWQIIPAGRRLFIQTLQDEAHTNLTVVTDRRSYQFDLRSASLNAGNEDRLVYVARFYYPDADWDKPAPVVAPDSVVQHSSIVPAAENEFNFNYTYTGPDAIAPVRIFDDGASTYFQFPAGVSPSIVNVTADGKELPASVAQQNGYYVVSGTSGRFTIRQGNDVVCVYNEQNRAN